MSILPIRVFPDPMLRKKARPIKRVDESIRRLARDMIETMQNAGGVGLAANQVGVLKRLVTLQMPEEDAYALINPEILKREGEREVEEGCLSVPGYTGLVKRSVRVTARYIDEAGSRIKLPAEELLSQAIEHEVDHLNGIVFLDHLIAHEELHKTGHSPDEPHWHDVGYSIYVDHGPAIPGDDRIVELLHAAAELSRLSAESSMSDAMYEVEGDGRVDPDDPSLKGAVLLEGQGRRMSGDVVEG